MQTEMSQISEKLIFRPVPDDYFYFCIRELSMNQHKPNAFVL